MMIKELWDSKSIVGMGRFAISLQLRSIQQGMLQSTRSTVFKGCFMSQGIIQTVSETQEPLIGAFRTGDAG